MVHGDQRGLALPPRVAPIQVVIVPIAAHKEGVNETAARIADELKAAGIRVFTDNRDQSPGWKFNEWEMKGVPIRLEIGPRDIENNQAVIVRRDTLEKQIVSMAGLASEIKAQLDSVHEGMYKKALDFRNAHTVEATDFDEMVDAVNNGNFVKAQWCGERACEEEIKAKTGITTRNMPFDQTGVHGKCIHCHKKSKAVMYFAKAY